MSTTLAAFIVTVLASLSVGFLMLKHSSHKEAWLMKIESQRKNPPKS